MREVGKGTVGKTMNRELAPEQKKALEIISAIDYLFESLVYGHSYYITQETVDKHVKIFLTSIKEKFIDLQEFIDTLSLRIRQAGINKYREDSEKKIELILETIKMPREDLPLLINERDDVVKAIALARIKYGEDQCLL